MRRALSTILALALGGSGCANQPPPVAASPEEPASNLPSWMPRYSAKQLALLSPVHHPIQVPVSRVLPDLGRFAYGADRPLTSVDESFKFTKMFATILTESPRFYALDEAPADLANWTMQYGPAAQEPDGFRTVVRGAHGAGELRPATFGEQARAQYEEGRRLTKANEPAKAAETFQSVIEMSPNVPALRLALAGALRTSGRPGEAETTLKDALQIDPTYAPFHFALAELAEKRGDIAGAKRALAEGLAYDPSSKGALEVATRIGGASSRVPAMAIFLDVDAVGAIHVATEKGSAPQMYGGCRAVMRYEPDVRAALFEEPPETPYYLSVVEEVVCLQAALGAYLFDRKTEPDAKTDATIEALLEIAHGEGLTGYAMFEILGPRRPERARLAPPEVHKAIVSYVEHHVLGDMKMPEGIYTAEL